MSLNCRSRSGCEYILEWVESSHSQHDDTLRNEAGQQKLELVYLVCNILLRQNGQMSL